MTLLCHYLCEMGCLVWWNRSVTGLLHNRNKQEYLSLTRKLDAKFTPPMITTPVKWKISVCCFCLLQARQKKHWIKWFQKNYLFEKIWSLCLKKKKTVSNVIEKLVEHGIHCLPCSYTNKWCHSSIIIATMTSHWCQTDVIGTTFYQGA